jgi:hypothetical protein
MHKYLQHYYDTKLLFYLVAVRESEDFNKDFKLFLNDVRDVNNLSDSGKLFHRETQL